MIEIFHYDYYRRSFFCLIKCIGYHKIITRPMDLHTIKEKINSYANMNEFLADIRLMFQNCSTFNRVCFFIKKKNKGFSYLFSFSPNQKLVNLVVH